MTHDGVVGPNRIARQAVSVPTERALVPPPIAARSLVSIVRQHRPTAAEHPDQAGFGYERVVKEDLVEVVAAGHLPQGTHLDARLTASTE